MKIFFETGWVSCEVGHIKVRGNFFFLSLFFFFFALVFKWE